MGWFLWGIAFGWGVCAIYYYSQTENDKAAGSSTIIFLALGIIAAIVSINLGIASGSIETNPPVITPTSLGR